EDPPPEVLMVDNRTMAELLQAPTEGSGTLPSNTITNPKEELKGITTRSGVTYQGPTIPTPSKQGTEPVVAPVSALMTNVKSSIPYPSRRDNERRRFNLKFYTHKILMEDDYKPAVQHQRRVNPKIHDVIKNEVEKLLDAGLIYPIYDSPWVSPTMEVFMDDFSVFGNSFENCLSRLDKMLQRIEVDRAKVDVIAKLPHPITVKGVWSFLGHAGFYRRFIQNFSKISRPMTHLLEKNTPFIFSEDYIKAFQTLKKKLTKAPILIAPNWDLPFELMCDASDFSIAKALPTNDARVVCKFLKSLFARFGAPRAIISDRGTHFCNDQFAKVMLKYEVTHRLSTAYHPQTSGKVKVSNRGLKRILKRTIGENQASWSDKLDDALWVFRTAYKTPIGCTPYKLVYGKACHLPIELEHKAYWVLKQANFDLAIVGDHRKI
nr:reverse transcriptase domain-containing protein [Tanacetum cinerariifolium]